MVKVEFHGDYSTDLQRLLTDKPNLAEEIDAKVKLFQKNPTDTRLDNHPLQGRLEGKYAFSVTDDIRIIYERIGKTAVRLLAVGTHKELYNRN